ncbi:MAG: hypothetical protein GY855_17730 [candidate division Zixibacteria bacterium]|nr:hypothetical protein [candidate division Zixibacteria bacterium]
MAVNKNYSSINGNIKAQWESKAERQRDYIDLRSSVAQPKINYFEYPNAFWVSDSLYLNSSLAFERKEEISKYIKDYLIPQFFTENTVIYRLPLDHERTGFYSAYYFNDSLVVISGDDTQYHFTVESNYSDASELITQANRFFYLPTLTPSLFIEEDWYGLKAEFEIDGKRAELRGYDRKYKLVDIDPNKEPPPPDKLEREIQVIELVVYNE